MSRQFVISGWARIFLMVLPYLFILALFQIVGGLIMEIDFLDPDLQKSPIVQKLSLRFFTFLGTLLIVWLFMKYVDREKFMDIGLHLNDRLKELFIGFFLGTIIMFLGFGLLQLLGEIQFQEVVFNFRDLLISIILFLLVSFTEEILFRGYVLRNLMYSFNKYIALILSALLFSFLHGLNPSIDTLGFTNIFLAGILLGITYIHTKNLWFPIALHFSWNFFQAFLGFKVSGQDAYSFVKFSINEPSILNGGEFGFEGSIFSLIAMLLTITAIVIYYHRQSKVPVAEKE